MRGSLGDVSDVSAGQAKWIGTSLVIPPQVSIDYFVYFRFISKNKISLHAKSGISWRILQICVRSLQ